MKATRYANYLKEQNIDKDELAEIKKDQKIHWMLNENHNFEPTSSAETLEEDKKAYEQILSTFDSISPVNFIETKLAESSLDVQKLQELEEDGKAYKDEIKDMDKNQLLSELETLKQSAGIYSKNSFTM